MIEVSDLTVRRGGTTIIEGYSFTAPRGSILAVLGANGIGKTTLLETLIGVIKPASGRLSISGEVGFVPQLFGVAFSYSVMDIVLMGRARHLGLFGAPGKRDYDIARRFLDLLKISHLEERVYNQLSGGQRQLVLIAQALSSGCQIMVMDEPCAALDYKNQDVVINVMRRLSEDHGITILFSTHAPQHAVEIATDVLLMNDRSSHRSGKTRDVLSEENLSHLYGMPIGRALFSQKDRFTYAPLFTE
ncbi:ABC transporter ATP-binding protein [Primorskyibacter sp. 2E233]|uniref:ABC transporter ATP-binding protein n=1 Tax=Primorskyibacter sp. 2E233 TaxID=3413431 RepID=UPI003BF35BA6